MEKTPTTIPLAPSYELARAQFMGWTFSIPTVEESLLGAGFILRCNFTCVCGRQEVFQYVHYDIRALQHCDPVRELTRLGSFSRDHLLEDGYTEAQVREIERKGEEFDRVTRQHWERQIMREHYSRGGFDNARK